MLVLVGQALQPGRHLLFGFHQDVQQIFGDVAVFIIKERRGKTCDKAKKRSKTQG